MAPIQVLISDDHHLVRQSLRALLEREGFEVMGEAANGEEAVELAQKLRPDVVVMDISMPKLNGIEAMIRIRRVCPEINTVLLTMHTDRQYIVEGLRSGAKGYVMKTHAAKELLRAIQEAARGGTYLSPEISGVVDQAD